MNIQPGSRQEKNSLAFMDRLVGTGGYKMRPVNYLMFEQVVLLELKIGSGEKVREEMTPDERIDETNVFIFLSAAPLVNVSRAVRRFRKMLASTTREEAFETLMSEAVEPFLAELSLEDKAEIAEQLSTLDEVTAAQVEAQPPHGSGKRTRPDPNSSSQGA